MSETTDEMEYVLRNSLEQAERTIADLRHRLNAETYTVIQLNSIGEKYKASLRHSNYKRCMAMARWCESENYIACWYHENSERCEWTEKWHERWLELAKQFKEAK